MIIKFDTLITNSTDTVNRIFHHFGVSLPDTLPEFENSNPGKFSTLYECSIKNKLESHFKQSVQNLYSLMARGGGPTWEPPFVPFQTLKTCH